MRVGVLASGAGTNLQAILDRVHGRHGVEVVAVGQRQGERAGAAARGARRRRDRRRSRWPAERAERDAAIADFLAEHGAELVVLAGYMALLTPGFLARFPSRVINVHPRCCPRSPACARSSRRSTTA